MFHSFFQLLRRLYYGFWLLVVIVGLGFATVFAWHLYEQEQFQTQLQEEGKLVTVRLQRTDRDSRVIWDKLNNVVYAGFTYRNRPYEVRYLNSTRWLSPGDTLSLLYLAPTDTFGQRQSVLRSVPLRGASRLIGWTSARDVSPEWLALGAFGLMAMILFVVVMGLILRLTSFTGAQTLAQIVLTLFLGAMALYLSYDTWQYYQYDERVSDHGQPMTVRVTGVDRHRVRGSTHKRSFWKRYEYDATVAFRGQSRRIAIDADDYDRLAAGDTRLDVRYDPTVDDFIAVNYSPDSSKLIAALVLWVMFAAFLRTTFTSASTTQQPVPPTQ
ncbi:hypothetical protein [Spirosoma rhododendri]|uniref:DUF3592 domain-containing protein n=1 Tax=Spirosoma rhododendri TaxID=2728024 RepID=A0A7L5DMH3_9BACT|nr:hypothetical protein [Spirosoma rhododendri]QJD77267.1 hypothetical protein HH216_01645 [Spirosoma rhododendri]